MRERKRERERERENQEPEEERDSAGEHVILIGMLAVRYVVAATLNTT